MDTRQYSLHYQNCLEISLMRLVDGSFETFRKFVKYGGAKSGVGTDKLIKRSVNDV